MKYQCLICAVSVPGLSLISFLHFEVSKKVWIQNSSCTLVLRNDGRFRQIKTGREFVEFGDEIFHLEDNADCYICK